MWLLATWRDGSQEGRVRLLKVASGTTMHGQWSPPMTSPSRGSMFRVELVPGGGKAVSLRLTRGCWALEWILYPGIDHGHFSRSTRWSPRTMGNRDPLAKKKLSVEGSGTIAA